LRKTYKKFHFLKRIVKGKMNGRSLMKIGKLLQRLKLGPVAKTNSMETAHVYSLPQGTKTYQKM
jgi:hypothetical protein